MPHKILFLLALQIGLQPESAHVPVVQDWMPCETVYFFLRTGLHLSPVLVLVLNVSKSSFCPWEYSFGAAVDVCGTVQNVDCSIFDYTELRAKLAVSLFQCKQNASVCLHRLFRCSSKFWHMKTDNATSPMRFLTCLTNQIWPCSCVERECHDIQCWHIYFDVDLNLVHWSSEGDLFRWFLQQKFKLQCVVPELTFSTVIDIVFRTNTASDPFFAHDVTVVFSVDIVSSCSGLVCHFITKNYWLAGKWSKLAEWPPVSPPQLVFCIVWSGHPFPGLLTSDWELLCTVVDLSVVKIGCS